MSSTPKRLKILVIVGPTASGKTALAIALAKKYGGEIVSADSRQVYRGMDIGTAKPKLVASGKWLVASGVPHRLIDVKNPNEDYTLAEYKRDALAAIAEILKREKLPIVVGGTGLYIQAVVDNWEIPEVKPNPALREKLEARIKKEGLEILYRELVERDPEAAYIVDPKNPRRVVRALEIAITTRKPFSAQRKKGEPIFDSLKIGIAVPKETLQKRIDARVDEMVADGLFREVKTLAQKYGKSRVAFDAIGYREVVDYFHKKNSREETIELIKKNTRNYARRQMTWFRKDKEIQWVRNEKEAKNLILKFLK